jgi:hypothetical protein
MDDKRFILEVNEGGLLPFLLEMERIETLIKHGKIHEVEEFVNLFAIKARVRKHLDEKLK